MTLSNQQRDELYELLGMLVDEQLDDAHQQRLAEFLADSEEAQLIYVREVNLHANLAWDWGVLTGDEDDDSAILTSQAAGDAEFGAASLVRADARGAKAEAGRRDVQTERIGVSPLDVGQRRELQRVGSFGASPLFGSSPFVVVDDSAPPHASSSVFAPGGILFSYTVAGLLVAIGLLSGWLRQVPNAPLARTGPSALASPVSSAGEEESPVFVGRITGLVDCRWANPADGALDSAYVPLGRKFSLASGLMEITYSNGPAVILQGPATYQVDSPDGGYLSLGKLTARVDESRQKIANAALSSPANSSESRVAPAFSIRTPTATVADLGTEFGVEVDASGASEAYVFRGQVEVRLNSQDNQVSRVIPLRENESALVRRAADSTKVVRRETPTTTYARKMPSRVPIDVKSTGYRLKEGAADPHWQLVARSDVPNFQPRPAIVVAIDPTYRFSNDPSESQWISTAGELLPLADEVTYTFRTTFDLTGMVPNTAVLHGRYLVDDRVVAIRLNGVPLELPANADTISFYNYRGFRATKGFVEGKNVLEIDVLNGGYPNSSSATSSYMTCRVELYGSVVPHWHQAQLQHTRPQAATGKEVRPGS